MKTEEKLYYFISKLIFRPISGHEDGHIIVHFLYCDDVYMMVYLKKKNDRYEVHYPAVHDTYVNNCENIHVDFKRNRSSSRELVPYLYYFKSANHAKGVEKEIKLAFRRWLKTNKEEQLG